MTGTVTGWADAGAENWPWAGPSAALQVNLHSAGSFARSAVVCGHDSASILSKTIGVLGHAHLRSPATSMPS